MKGASVSAPLVWDPIAPYALAKSSYHLTRMARSYDGGPDAFWIRVYLSCTAIELGLKAAVRWDDSSVSTERFLRLEVRHDLLALNERFVSSFGPIFEDQDIAALTKINPVFKNKGLEYFTGPVVETMLTGRKDLPSITDMLTTAEKVSRFLEERSFCISARKA